MLSTPRLVITVPLILLAASCTPDGPVSDAPSPAAMPTAADLAQGLLDAMGGRTALEGVETIVARGAGTRTRLGQIPFTGGEDPQGSLASVTETIDLARGRAAFDYDVMLEGFMQHRTEVLTRHNGALVGWATGPGRPDIATSPNGLFSWATQNSPVMLLRRNIVTIALAAADSATSTPAEERLFGGGTSLHATAELPSGEEIELYYDPDSGLLDGFVALDTETMLGDVEAIYSLDDYRATEGLVLPYAVDIEKEGRPYSSIEYTSIAINDPSTLGIFSIPTDATDQADAVVAANDGWAPLQWNEVADGVYHAVGYSHHSMVVEFPDFVAVIEAPYTEAQSQRLRSIIEEEIAKPIAYVVPTHPHYDHTGGVRGIAATGATVLVAAGHEAELRGIVESPHTNPPDELSRRAQAGEEVGTIEVFSGTTEIAGGTRRLELHELTTIPHVNPKVIAYVADAGIVFQSDLFFGAPSEDAKALYEAIGVRGLEVESIVGGHGGVIPFATLEEVVGE
jgi:glyoxylase-like metal-dependent hydrolase (beta-lactamase superfamily II)